MTRRPTDWSPVRRTSDPVPGDPVLVRELARRYRDTAAAIRDAADGLRKVSDAEGWDSEAGREFASQAGDLGAQIKKAQQRFETAHEALTTYAAALEAAQHKADRARQQAEARREAERREAEQGATFVKPVGPSPEERQVDEAVDDYNRAADEARRKIGHVVGSDGLNDDFWDDVGGFFIELGEIAGTIAAVAGILALCVSWIPVIGQALAAVLGAVALIGTVLSAISNILKGDMVNLVWDLVGIATFGIGRALGGAVKLAGKIGQARAWKSLKIMTRKGLTSKTMPFAKPANYARMSRKGPPGGWSKHLGPRALLRNGFGNRLVRGDIFGNGKQLFTLSRNWTAERILYDVGVARVSPGGWRSVGNRLFGNHDVLPELGKLQRFGDDVLSFGHGPLNAGQMQNLATTLNNVQLTSQAVNASTSLRTGYYAYTDATAPPIGGDPVGQYRSPAR